MLDPPAAQRAQKKHLGKALLTGKLGGIFGVGVVLDVRQDDDIVVLLHRTGRGIEIPQDDIGLAAQRRAVAVAASQAMMKSSGRSRRFSSGETGQAERITQRITFPSSASP